MFNRCLTEKCFPDLWKVLAVCKNTIKRSTFAPPASSMSFLRHSSSRRLSITSKETTPEMTKYVFTRSTVDVLTVNTHRKTLDNKSITEDILKAFDNVWHRGLPHKLPTYGISERVFLIIKSIPLGMYMKAVINVQFFDTHEINAGVHQGSIPRLTFSPIY